MHYSKRYDKNIDVAILSELYPKRTEYYSNKTSFNKLYHRICKNYKTISKPTFSFHLKRMKDDQKLIDKHDNSVRGTSVNFFITEAGKQKYQFYNSSASSNTQLNEERLERIYQLLFSFVTSHVFNALYSDEEFESFLSKIPVSKDRLVVNTVRLDENPYEDIDEDMLILKSTRTTFRPIKSEILIWKEEIEYLPLKQRVLSYDETEKDIKNRITLQLQERLKNESIEKSYSYEYFIPGISQSDFIEHSPTLKYIGFTNEEVIRIFDYLEKNHIIKPINDHLGEKRYSINSAHKSLGDLISEYAGIKLSAILKMHLIWSNFRRLTYEEWKWYEFLNGKDRTVEFSRFAYESRNSLRRAKKKRYLEDGTKQKIKEIDSEISKTLRDLEKKYSDIIQKYSFPLKGLLDMIYPKFIQQATYNICKTTNAT